MVSWLLFKKKLEGSIIHNTGLFAPSGKGHAPDESLDVEAVKKFMSVTAYTFQGLMTADTTLEEEPVVAVDRNKCASKTRSKCGDHRTSELHDLAAEPSDTSSGMAPRQGYIDVFALLGSLVMTVGQW